MPPISPTNQDWLATAAGTPTQYAPGLTPPAPSHPVVLDASTSVPANGSAVAGGGTSGATQAASDYYKQLNDQLAFQKSLLPQQAAIGHQNVLDAYNAAYRGLQNDQGTADQQAGIQRNQSITDNSLARDQVARNVYDQNSALQRLLGSRGAGDSSASEIEVPYEAAKQGNEQLTGIQRDYGRNLSAMDIADLQRKHQFENAFGDLLTQRQNNDSQVDSGLASTQQGLDQSIARYRAYAGMPIDPAASNEVNALSQKITDLGKKVTFTPTAVDTSMPNLAAYTADRYAAPGATQSSVDPSLQGATGAFSSLLGLDKNKKVGAL